MRILATDLDRTLLPNGKWEADVNAIDLFNDLQPTDDVILLSDLSSLWVVGEVPEREASLVSVGQSADIEAVFRDSRYRARERPAHGVRGGGLPEYWRMLGQETRHLYDHGRHLHAGVRVLQRSDRDAAAA